MSRFIIILSLMITLSGCQSSYSSSQSHTLYLIGKHHTASPARQTIEASRANSSAKDLIPPSEPIPESQKALEKGMLLFSIIRVVSTPIMAF